MTSLDSLLKLQNGSDVRGVAMDGGDGAEVTLTPEVARHIAGAFAHWLAGRTARRPLRVGVGHDSRLTAQPLKDAVAAGLREGGAQVLDCGMASTPAMFMGCVYHETDFDGAVMVTASHLPKDRNGMKFFTKEGGIDREDVTTILSLQPLAGMDAGPEAEQCPLMERYAGDLRAKITDFAGGEEAPLEGLHIVVDAGNGAGGFFTADVLEPLGASCAGSQFLEPDGAFPNHVPNPENAEAMASVCAAVKDAGADFGIIFDTDVDRMAAVLAGGQAVSRNAFIALMSAIIAPDYPGATIVTDSVTSNLLTEFLEGRLGLMHHRFCRGYRNVINEARRLELMGTLAPLAIETSGHGALAENHYLDDGAYLAVRIVAAAAKAKKAGGALGDLLKGYHAPAAEAERRIAVTGEGFAEYGRQALEAFAARATLRGLHLAHTYEGVRINVPGKGWLLLRLSLHDPVMPLNVEGKSEAACAELLALAASLLAGFERLDISPLGALPLPPAEAPAEDPTPVELADAVATLEGAGVTLAEVAEDIAAMEPVAEAGEPEADAEEGVIEVVHEDEWNEEAEGGLE